MGTNAIVSHVSETKWSTKNVIKCSAKHLMRDFRREFIACAIFESRSIAFVCRRSYWRMQGDERHFIAFLKQQECLRHCLACYCREGGVRMDGCENNSIMETHRPHFVIIISVPILWNSDQRSAFCNLTSAPGSEKRGEIGGSWRAGNSDEYGSEIRKYRKSIKSFVKFNENIAQVAAAQFRFQRN